MYQDQYRVLTFEAWHDVDSEEIENYAIICKSGKFILVITCCRLHRDAESPTKKPVEKFNQT